MAKYNIISANELGYELDDIKDTIDNLVDSLENDNLTNELKADILDEIDILSNDPRYRALLEIENDLITMVRNGDNLILIDDFTEYLKENYEDMYSTTIPNGLTMYINWDELANDLSHNYTVIEFDGDEYFVI